MSEKLVSLLKINAVAFLLCTHAILASESTILKLIPFQKNAIITGRVTATKNCEEASDRRTPIVWLSMGQILLYQVEVPVNGNYEFHVVPGKYDVLATSSNGCLGQAQTSAQPKQVAQIQLRLAPNRAVTAEK